MAPRGRGRRSPRRAASSSGSSRSSSVRSASTTRLARRRSRSATRLRSRGRAIRGRSTRGRATRGRSTRGRAMRGRATRGRAPRTARGTVIRTRVARSRSTREMDLPEKVQDIQVADLKLDNSIQMMAQEHSGSKMGAQAIELMNSVLNTVMKNVATTARDNSAIIPRKKIISYIDILTAAGSVFDGNEWIQGIMERGEPLSQNYGEKLVFNESRRRASGRGMRRSNRKTGADA